MATLADDNINPEVHAGLNGLHCSTKGPLRVEETLRHPPEPSKGYSLRSEVKLSACTHGENQALLPEPMHRRSAPVLLMSLTLTP